MTVVILWYINVLFMQHCQVLLNNDFAAHIVKDSML